MGTTIGEWMQGADKAAAALRERARERAVAYLERKRKGLPRMTKTQKAIVVEMLVAAYVAGKEDESMENSYRETCRAQDEWNEMHERSRKAVEARRRKSKRQAIVEAFKAAKGTDVSIEKLARDHGVSRATAYRAIGMTTPKSPK